jgi:hypothetical protein
VRYVSTDYTLHHIRPIQAVHAVRAHVPHLSVYHLTRAIVDFLSSVHPELQVGHEIVKGVKFILDLVDKFREVLPTHLAALVVEVEPHILNKVVLQSIHDVSESSADTKLRALFVNQIDENLLTIGGFNLGDMFMCEVK